MSDSHSSAQSADTAFVEIINRFSVLLRHQQRLSAELSVPDFDVSLYDEERFLAGSPMITCVPQDLYLASFKDVAPQAWAAMRAVFPDLAPGLEVLGKKLDADESFARLCLQAVAGGNEDALMQAGMEANVAPEFLLTALRTAWSPVMTAARDGLIAPAAAKLWRKSYCPVCGSDPDLSTLENHADTNEFLVSKSGETWHHCPTCGHHWRFVRMSCAGCGCQDHEQLNRLSIPDRPHEFIYTCDSCRQYLPCLNLIENPAAPELDLAALHLVHLDAVAQTRGYWPLSPAPWAALGLVQPMGKVC